MTAIMDSYPTRHDATSTFVDRHDPVVWSDGTGPLTRTQLADYERTGYLRVDELISAEEVARCSAEMRRLAEEPALTGDERVVLEGGVGEVRSIFEIHRLSDYFASLLTGRRLVDLARQILGSDVYIHQSRVNYKPGFTGGPFQWHSDFETWHAEDGLPSPRAFSMSIALTPNYEFNGSLMIVPGSHRTFVSCPGETPDEHFRTSLSSHAPQVGVPDQRSVARLAEDSGIDQLTGSAGSAILFDSNCLHGSNGNITPFPRSNVFVVFNSVHNAPAEPFAAAHRRPPFVASRDTTALR